MPRDPLEAAVHAHIIAVAQEHGVTTDEVMLVIGMLCRDFSTAYDPRLTARIAAMKCPPHKRQSLRDAALSMVTAVRSIQARRARREE